PPLFHDTATPEIYPRKVVATVRCEHETDYAEDYETMVPFQTLLAAAGILQAVSYTHVRAHETRGSLVGRLRAQRKRGG
ncbi:hypothetical protein WKH48_18870, partial [Bordetella pertussis]